MGGRHAHRAGDDVEVPRLQRWVLLGALALVALTAVVGVLTLWPDGERVDQLRDDVDFAAPGVTFPTGTVRAVEPACDEPGLADDCGGLTVAVGDGAEQRLPVPPHVSDSALSPGDTVRLIRTPAGDGVPERYSYFGTERPGTLWLLAGVFCLVVLLTARLRGLFALLGLAFSGLVMGGFLLPALLAGESPTLVALTGCTAIMFVVLYSTHGVSVRTSAALAGTLLGVAITAGLGAWTVHSSRLTGVSGEGAGALQSNVEGLGFQGLLTCAVVIAGLGVLNDVTITQASAVWELRAAGPGASRYRLFTSAMRIGRDHIASAIYTILFAYAGTALLVLLMLELYALPTGVLLSTEEIASEVVRTLVTSLGLVLAVPLTTGIAALTVPGPRSAAAGPA